MVFSLVSLLFVPYSFSQTDSVATPDTVVVLPDTVLPDTMVVAETLIIDTVVARPADPVKPIAKKDIYQGMTLKLDLVSTAVVLGASMGKIQHYELAMNWRLINRLYPTFELGYAGGTRAQGDSLHYSGQGGFFRVGLDINPLKKHPESPHALLIGVRLGTAVQGITQSNDNVAAPAYRGIAADCWGEIVAGCQVEIARGKTTKGKRPMAFYMGWMGRFRCLFTRQEKAQADSVEALTVPIYIPGFGNRDNIGWGLSYHLGWHF